MPRVQFSFAFFPGSSETSLPQAQFLSTPVPATGDVDKRADVAILGCQAARWNPIEALRYK